MKKFLVFGLCSTLLLTGCGGKKLTCTRTEDMMGMETSEKIVFTFKNDEISTGSFSGDIKVGEEYAEYMSEMKESVEAEYEDLSEIVDLKVSTKDDVISINVTYNTKDLSDDEKSELRSQGLYAKSNYEDTKEHFEDEGYTCK